MEEQLEYYKDNYQYNFNQQQQDQIIYPLNMTFSQDQQYVYLSMSNGSIQVLQATPQGFTLVANLQNAHDKKIHQLLAEDDILISASNDGTVKLWDIKNGYKKIHTFEKPDHEITSITKSQHILAAGTDKETIQFWDLLKMQERGQFDETLPNEVTSVVFNKSQPTALLGSSLEGMVCLFDLTQEDEEDSAQFVIRMSQPIDRCNFFGNSPRYAYAISTVNTIDILDMEQSKIIQHVDAINYNEYNENYLIDVYENKQNELRYFLGNNKGQIDEIIADNNKTYKKKIETGHTEIITCCKYSNSDILITCAQDGFLKLSQKSQVPFQQQTKIEMEAQQQYFESEEQQQKINPENNMIQRQQKYGQSQKQKNKSFNPF